jgi:hypothetical protein
MILRLPLLACAVLALLLIGIAFRLGLPGLVSQ